MSPAWAVTLALSAGSLAIRGVAPVAMTGRRLPGSVERALSQLAPAMLTALIVTDVCASGHALSLDARAAGLGAAGLALCFRAPILVVAGIAALVTAAARSVVS
ncbi:MAG: AzlD domain-containing protein [Candidatus Dormibacteria bacterium]